MGVDYYSILNVSRGASAAELKKAYRNNKVEAEAKLKQISEAYEVLSHPQKRAIYDQYGEKGLKGQFPPPEASSFSNGGGRNQDRFNPRTADDIFAEFFGNSESGPFGGVGSRTAGVQDSMYGGLGGAESIFSQFGGEGFSIGTAPTGPCKATAVEQKLPCTLEDLYNGATKKMKISRNIADSSGKILPVEEILTIEIKRGWKKGTKITFLEKVNKGSNVVPADLIFVVDEKPHDVYKRDGNDLIVDEKISLSEALTGCTVNLKTLDGRNLNIPVTEVIKRGYVKFVPNEGMPITKEPGKRGNLRINLISSFLPG